MAYTCLSCSCLHGHEIDQRVTKITRYHKKNDKEIWSCPKCQRQHTSHDGLAGMPEKKWKGVNPIHLGERVIICADQWAGAYATYSGAEIPTYLINQRAQTRGGINVQRPVSEHAAAPA